MTQQEEDYYDQQQVVEKAPPAGGSKSRTKHLVMGITAVPIALLILVPVISVMSLFLLDMNAIVDTAVQDGVVDSSMIEQQIFGDQFYLTATMLAQFLIFALTAYIAYVVVAWGSIKAGGFKALLEKFGLPTRFDKTFWKHVGIGAAIGLIALGGLQLLSNILASADMPIESSETSQMLGDSGSWIILALVVPIIGPFVEELFFRGYIQGFLSYPNVKKGVSSIVALIVSSLLFSLVHLQGLSTLSDVFVLIWTFLLGLTFGLTYLKTGKITMSITAHIAYNGLTVLAMIVMMIAGG